MLNQNYSQSVMINTQQLEWETSPARNVWRKKLEREAEESGKATSLVKYGEGASFSTHTHPAGEEIFVITGTFSDESGDYPAGSYLRNPAKSKHAPFSDAGCELFVKLCYFAPGDVRSVRIDSNVAGWQQGMTNAQKILPVHQFNEEITQLIELDNDASWHPVIPDNGFEALILSGELREQGKKIPALSWLRRPAGKDPRFTVENGPVRILLKTGHLPKQG
ncbi:DUF4437 domain-containing protein [Salinimonas sp. HHU 13199]|uniref:DUF4437 domain-containing protein n=1 Tax=Salinimonas profundi TaxID=2729140 RepID=A0ABR8LN18_9ALTE|nr:cupin domain-containing protein [Salinimonas profundi]MBD3586331.1 DUF4437 domain-containing protein [Salinimonas profundi]